MRGRRSGSAGADHRVGGATDDSSGEAGAGPQRGLCERGGDAGVEDRLDGIGGIVLSRAVGAPAGGRRGRRARRAHRSHGCCRPSRRRHGGWHGQANGGGRTHRVRRWSALLHRGGGRRGAGRARFVPGGDQPDARGGAARRIPDVRCFDRRRPAVRRTRRGDRARAGSTRAGSTARGHQRGVHQRGVHEARGRRARGPRARGPRARGPRGRGRRGPGSTRAGSTSGGVGHPGGRGRESVVRKRGVLGRGVRHHGVDDSVVRKRGVLGCGVRHHGVDDSVVRRCGVLGCGVRHLRVDVAGRRVIRRVLDSRFLAVGRRGRLGIVGRRRRRGLLGVVIDRDVLGDGGGLRVFGGRRGGVVRR